VNNQLKSFYETQKIRVSKIDSIAHPHPQREPIQPCQYCWK